MPHRQTSFSERKIFTRDFPSLNEAILQMNSFDYGVMRKSKFGEVSITISDEPSRDDKNDLHFESQNQDGFYYYTIENHTKFHRLCVYKTNKHRMITAAEAGDIEMFIESFSNTDKMKEFSLSTAIVNKNWNIVEYLTDNYDLKKRPVWDAIRYNNVEIVSKLLDKGHKLPKDWLAYCIYSDSFDVARELLTKRKAHLIFPTEEIKTSWFHREIIKKSRTAEFVRGFVK